MKVLFLHGWTSVPGGVKPTYLAGCGHTVINPALPDEDFAAAVKIAQAEFDRHQPDAVVGSSRGGAVAMNIQAGSVPACAPLPRLEALGQRHVGQAGHGDPSLRGRRRGADRRQPRAADPQRPAAVGTPRGRDRSPPGRPRAPGRNACGGGKCGTARQLVSIVTLGDRPQALDDSVHLPRVGPASRLGRRNRPRETPHAAARVPGTRRGSRRWILRAIPLVFSSTGA